MNTEPIWIIDPDPDDRHIVTEVWETLQLSNELRFLESGEDAFALLAQVEKAPFIIICELNLPKEDGFELREKLLATNSKKFKSVPFIYWTTHASEDQITRAYDLSVHGFFIKETSFEGLQMTFQHILNYWLRSKMPAKRDATSVFG